MTRSKLSLVRNFETRLGIQQCHLHVRRLISSLSAHYLLIDKLALVGELHLGTWDTSPTLRSTWGIHLTNLLTQKPSKSSVLAHGINSLVIRPSEEAPIEASKVVHLSVLPSFRKIYCFSVSSQDDSSQDDGSQDDHR